MDRHTVGMPAVQSSLSLRLGRMVLLLALCCLLVLLASLSAAVPASAWDAHILPLAADTAVPGIELASTCTADPGVSRGWRVRNPNDFAVAVTWQLQGTAHSGSLTLPQAGEADPPYPGASSPLEYTFLETPAVAGTNTLIITYGDSQQLTRTSSGERCRPPGVVLNESYGASGLAEGALIDDGSVTCYWINLTSEPVGDVTVSVSAPAKQVTVDRQQVRLHAGNWNNLTTAAPGNLVCVRPVNDDIDDGASALCKDGHPDLTGQDPAIVVDKECGDHVAYVKHAITASADPAYPVLGAPFFSNSPEDLDGDPASVDVLIVNDDRAAIFIEETAGVTQVVEGSALGDTYRVWLGSEPQAPVTINLLSDNQVDTSVNALAFTAANWNTPQEVLVTAVDDALFEAGPPVCFPNLSGVQVCGDHQGQVDHTASSSDAHYGAAALFVSNGPTRVTNPARVLVLLEDDEAPGLVFTPGTLNAEEGFEATYEVALATEPTADVLVSAPTTIPPEEGAAPQEALFTPQNWDEPQTFTILVPDNEIAEGPHYVDLPHTVASTDADYASLTPSLSVFVLDDDAAGVRVSVSEVLLSEDGGEATYHLALTAAPWGDLVIEVVPDEQVTVAPERLTFTDADWTLPQTITVSAVNDAYAEGTFHEGRIKHQIVDAGGSFAFLIIPDVTARIVDNDEAGVLQAGPAISRLAEGDSVSYSLVLSSQPRAPVTFILQGGDHLAVSPLTLAFSPENWFEPQEIQVLAQDDDVDDGVEYTAAVRYTLLSSDSQYDRLEVAETVLTVIDDDTAGLLLATDAVRLGEGESATYRVQLASRPIGPVLIDLAADEQLVLSQTACYTAALGRNCLFFAPDQWDIPQEVTITAVDDSRYESPPGATHRATIMHTIFSSDPRYAALKAVPFFVDIEDNELPTVYLPQIVR